MKKWEQGRPCFLDLVRILKLMWKTRMDVCMYNESCSVILEYLFRSNFGKVESKILLFYGKDCCDWCDLAGLNLSTIRKCVLSGALLSFSTVVTNRTRCQNSGLQEGANHRWEQNQRHGRYWQVGASGFRAYIVCKPLKQPWETNHTQNMVCKSLTLNK